MKIRPIVSLQGFGALMVTCALAPLIHAQSGSATRRPDPVQREQQRQFELHRIEATLERSAATSEVRKQPLVLSQIREDFLRIQVIDRKLREATSGKHAFSFAFVAKSVTEIRKRALRLKSNLAFPEFEEMLTKAKIESVTEPDQLRLLLSVLSDSIYEFVSNPMFLSAKVVDARLAAKARQDLELVIGLSNELKRSSEKLKLATR
jgi:hypothetical protein